MKKKTEKKLVLARETVRELQARVHQAKGGLYVPPKTGDGSQTFCDVCDAVRTRVC